MSWLWRADADGGTDGEGTPRRAESADGMPSDMGQWEESNAAAAEGIATGNSEFEANRFDMVRPITQERLGLLFDSEGWAWRIDDDSDLPNICSTDSIFSFSIDDMHRNKTSFIYR